MRQILPDLKDHAEDIKSAIETSLQDQLREGSLKNVQECVNILMIAVRSPGKALSNESFSIFNEKVEAAQLVATILGAEGKVFNKSIEAASDFSQPPPPPPPNTTTTATTLTSLTMNNQQPPTSSGQQP